MTRRLIALALVANALLVGLRAWQTNRILNALGPIALPSPASLDGDGDVRTFLASTSVLPVCEAQAPGDRLTAEQAEILGHLSLVRDDERFGGRKTLRIRGLNVQILSESGDESRDGTGNLIIGPQSLRSAKGTPFVEASNLRTGSHNLIIGRWHNYTSKYGLASGEANAVIGEECVAFGGTNVAGPGPGAVVLGGRENVAAARGAAVVAGRQNRGFGRWSAVLGGRGNLAGQERPGDTPGDPTLPSLDPDAGIYSAVAGGRGNSAAGAESSVGGGTNNLASGPRASVVGGAGNVAAADSSSVLGGANNRSHGSGAVVVGGQLNTTGAEGSPDRFGHHAVVVGGLQNSARSITSVVLGGTRNETGDLLLELSPEAREHASIPGRAATVLGGEGVRALDELRSAVGVLEIQVE